MTRFTTWKSLSNKFIDHGDSNRFMVIVSDTTFYQFKGKNKFEDLFNKFNSEEALMGCMKVFPRLWGATKLQCIKTQEGYTFGWMTGAGFSLAKAEDLNQYFKSFTILPYVYINRSGIVANDEIPKFAGQSKHHVFFQFEDNLTVISKVTSNIVYHEKMPKIVVNSVNYLGPENSVFIASGKKIQELKILNEEKEIWKEFVEKHEFKKALEYAQKYDFENSTYVARVFADNQFREGQYNEAAKLYSISNENFEEITLKFMMIDQFEALLYYLDQVQENPNIKKNTAKQIIIATWRIEILTSQLLKCQNAEEEKIQSSKLINTFYDCWLNHIIDVRTVTQLLLDYGRVEEYIAVCEIDVIN